MNQVGKMSSNDENLELQKQILALEETIKKYLSKEALTRFYNIKTVNPEFAIQIMVFIREAINQKYINQKLTDSEFKDLLKKLQQPKKDFKIIK